MLDQPTSRIYAREPVFVFPRKANHLLETISITTPPPPPNPNSFAETEAENEPSPISITNSREMETAQMPTNHKSHA